ncbi:MAG: tRNA 2-selenouridine(34) synthase MnmH [Firmicutes bacterium]|nr:tRNA 2-selenouridine(34) synthase MnmH [Bacillota bacterium]
MKALLSVDQLITNRARYYVVDVRSPSEYAQAHIPGAVNVPLLDNEERVQVGTTYWEEGTDRAKEVGLSLVAPRLPQMIEKILQAAESKEVVIYCWRGGTRSRSVCSVMEALNYPVWQLAGGYKGFRRYIHNYLDEKKLDVPIFVLNGLTGVGKTRVIHILQAQGAPALDLEGLANHRGSAFGAVGLGEAHSQKDFEALLALALMQYEHAPYLIVEGEGKRIGPVILPTFLFEAMGNGPHILLEATLALRGQRIVEEYQGREDNIEELVAALQSLRKRLGKEKSEELVALIRQGDLQTVAEALCVLHYDLFYRDSQKNKDAYIAVVNLDKLAEGANAVLAVIENYLAREE